MTSAVPLLTKLLGAWRKKKKKQKEIVSGIETEPQWTDLLIVNETEVRDHTVQMDVMQGAAAVQSQTRMKQIGARQLPTERRITAKAALRILYSPLEDEAIVVSGNARGIVISTGHTAVAAKIQLATMIANDGIGRMSGRSFTADEVIPGAALMNCLMVMKDPVEVGDAELTVMSKVVVAPG
jgi:hypothetical protein